MVGGCLYRELDQIRKYVKDSGCQRVTNMEEEKRINPVVLGKSWTYKGGLMTQCIDKYRNDYIRVCVCLAIHAQIYAFFFNFWVLRPVTHQ